MNKAAIDKIDNLVVKTKVEALFSNSAFLFQKKNAPILQLEIMDCVNTAKRMGDEPTAEYLEKELFSSKMLTGVVQKNRQRATGELVASGFSFGGNAVKDSTGGCQGAGCQDGEIRNTKKGKGKQKSKRKYLGDLSFKDKIKGGAPSEIDNLNDERTIEERVAEYNGDVDKCKTPEEVQLCFGYKTPKVPIGKVVSKMRSYLLQLDPDMKDQLVGLTRTKAHMVELSEVIFDLLN